ncbi:DeoR/GlpR family DNA-binding transcription regulator [Brevibacillus daliensis]|uniref:DeoR/GlpR family DNA-binding transcription regulator n=1 Tax=Brevibacillus daliensis TaxID=2892995 RepID=UPI001E4B72E6|nr:DeoR/GlpR family DNA-binding transcription regulator [Brevibacillus daliensis]
MFAEERREKILEILHNSQRVLVKDLADQFQVSIDSIRRDLSILEEQGLLKKTHGGAIPFSAVRKSSHSTNYRQKDGVPHINAIAKTSVSYIQENDTIFLGGSQFHNSMLSYLPQHLQMTVVTNSIKIAEHLREWEKIDVYVVGGLVKKSGIMTDIIANEMIKQFTIDICFLTADAVSLNGLSTSTPELASFSRAVMAVSRRRFCLASHDIMGEDAFSKVCPLSSIHVVITDEGTPKQLQDEMEKLGVEVTTAKGSNHLSSY